MANYASRFRDITANQSVDEQSKTFLKAFVAEFSGKFQEVLDIAEEFKGFSSQTGHIRELDEFEAHRFLEKKGETKTVVDLREQLRNIDLDSNNHMAFIEYLLFRYKKTLADLLDAKPDAILWAKLEKAIENHMRVIQERKDREEKIAQLEKLVAAGGPGVGRAKIELHQLKSQNPAEDTKKEHNAILEKLQAKRALKNPEEEAARAYAEEQERHREEIARKEAEEQRKRDESRNRLKERSKLWS